jgi:cytoskeletal protein RodZ
VRIGESLAAARCQAGLTVAEVSERTCIRKTIIEGIEDDDYSACGGDFYARGHIRSIAKAVGADAGPLIEEYDATHRAPGVLSAVSLDELLAPARDPGQGSRGQASRPRRLPGTVVLGLALVIIVGTLALAFLPGLLHSPRTPATGRRVTAAHNARHATASSVPKTNQGAAGPAPTATRPASTATPPTAAAAQPLAPASAVAFGSSGPGQGDNPELASLAIDRNQATAWHTDWYTSARFGNLYPGTGLLLDMGRTVTITAARITLGSSPGARFQVRVGAAPALAGLPPVARASSTGGAVRLQFTTPVRGRYVLIWFTRLPPDSAGTFQVSVHDVEVDVQA